MKTALAGVLELVTRFKVADWVVLPDPAVTIAVLEELIFKAEVASEVIEAGALADAVKLADACPAPIVTLEGTERFPLLLDNEMVVTDGDAKFNETVQDVLPGITTLLLAQLSPVRVG